MNSYSDILFDNFKFINQELYLYFITQLIRSSEFDLIDFFLLEKYITISILGQKTKDFTDFNCHIESLDERRKTRLKLNRISITADMLHDSANVRGIPFDLIMQTDFILSLRSVLSTNNYNFSYRRWFPITLVYKKRWHSEPFELFVRAESKNHFDVIKKLLKIENKTDLVNKLEEATRIHNLASWRFNYDRIPIEAYLNIESLYDGK
ncbi:hypothetical protein [Aeromonas hydrophila]|uniref:hypothetical protein n=1 Tax=Aeromonas hydrophila TaxID=644 RepID=UPI003D21D480